MPIYRLSFEDMGFTDSKSILENRLTPDELQSFNQTSSEEGTFPKGVIAVLGAYVTEDDGQGDNDIKVFVPVALAVEADSEQAADSMPIPPAFLSRVADLVCTENEQCAVGLENSWKRADPAEEVPDGELYYDEEGVKVDLQCRSPRP